jgi:hypothetical protein
LILLKMTSLTTLLVLVPGEGKVES